MSAVGFVLLAGGGAAALAAWSRSSDTKARQEVVDRLRAAVRSGHLKSARVEGPRPISIKASPLDAGWLRSPAGHAALETVVGDGWVPVNGSGGVVEIVRSSEVER